MVGPLSQVSKERDRERYQGCRSLLFLLLNILGHVGIKGEGGFKRGKSSESLTFLWLGRGRRRKTTGMRKKDHSINLSSITILEQEVREDEGGGVPMRGEKRI